MTTIKIEKIDNGYILSWVKRVPSLGGQPTQDSVVVSCKDMQEVTERLNKEFK